MADFGISTVLGWDLEALAGLGTDLGVHSNDVRDCFADFRGASDLSDAWRGNAAEAAYTSSQALATDLYDLADTLGLMGDEVLRKQADLLQAQDTIRKTRTAAVDGGFDVADDGSVTLSAQRPEGEPHNIGENSELLQEASNLASTLKKAIGDAAAADLDLARALRSVAAIVAEHGQDGDVVVNAVNYIAPVGPVLPGTAGKGVDPFLADVTILGPTHPKPGDPGFAMYWDALTPQERAAAASNWGGVPKDFDPFDGVQGGQLLSWAQSWNIGHGTGVDPGCTTKDGSIGKGYGYLGGGTITGPDGSQWPIVSPYYSDGKHVYLQDSDPNRPDGGINDLDGNDPGWHTVESYVGPGGFGTVSASTKSIIIMENTTGQDLEVNPVNSAGVSIGPNGLPEYGGGEHHEATPDGNKPYWDVETEKSKPFETEPEPKFNPTEASAGAASLGIQAGQGVLGAQAAGEHGEREYQVSYQVNDDGRVRAVVNTYTSGPNEDGGGTNVGGFSTSFPDGKHGSASEVPIDVRNPPPSPYPHTSALPDPKVHYLGDDNRNGEVIDNTRVLKEKLDR